MLNYVVYSHTDYLDVLKIQTDYLENYCNKTLLINKSNIKTDIYNKYEKVLFYDDVLPYASRLLILSQLDDDFINFHHETDIIIKKDDAIIENLISIMEKENIDRIDLQWRNQNEWNPHTKKINVLNFQLSKQDNIMDYIFNVNPALWKLRTFLNVHEKFKNEKYKTIEWDNINGTLAIQKYCKDFNFYKLWSAEPLRCGALICLYFFQYIHITRNGKWFPLNEPDAFGNNPTMLSEYHKIVEKYNLKNSNRKFYGQN